jgi:hypothetical protein
MMNKVVGAMCVALKSMLALCFEHRHDRSMIGKSVLGFG